MATLTTEAIRNIDNFQVKLPTGQYEVVYYPIYETVKKGNTYQVTDTPMILNSSTVNTIQSQAGKDLDRDMILRDEKTGQLFYRTTHQSRFLKYGFTGAADQLVAQDYTGNSQKWSFNQARPLLDSGAIYAYDLTYSTTQDFQNLSISRLMILITLKKAEEAEELLITEMGKLTTSNAKLDALSDIADMIIDPNDKNDVIDTTKKKIKYNQNEVTISDFFKKELGVELKNNPILKEDLMDEVRNQQDKLNNVSQETMINIQKLITARDQRYLLGSVGSKLLQNGNMMIARNI